MANGIVRIDECLSKRDGHLWIEEVDKMDIVAQHPPPFFVISENQLRRNVRSFQKFFQACWLDDPVKILLTAKANWITAIQMILTPEGCGCDIYSQGKLVDTISMRPNQKIAHSIEQHAQACTVMLREMLPKHGVDTKGLMFQVEPDRWNQFTVDSTEFWFTYGSYQHHLHNYTFANKVDKKLDDKADINGRSCYSDRLMQTIPIPKKMVGGDIYAMLDTNAYQEVFISQLCAMPRPATLLVKWRQSRKRKPRIM